MPCFKTVVFLLSIQLFFLIIPLLCELNLFFVNIGYGEDPSNPEILKAPKTRTSHQLTTHEILSCLVLLVLMFHIIFELCTLFSTHFIYIFISEMLVLAIYLLAFHEPKTGDWWMIAGVIVSAFVKFCYTIVAKLNPNLITQFMYYFYDSV